MTYSPTFILEYLFTDSMEISLAQIKKQLLLVLEEITT